MYSANFIAIFGCIQKL